MVSFFNDQSALPFILSFLVVTQAHEHFVCKDECYNIQFSDEDVDTREDVNSTSNDDRRKSNMAEFLFTAPCPPIWNFTLACNYFSRKTISCEESTSILKRCLQYYDSYIPCNTTLDVIERCMEENATECESLFDLYNNYCLNTCRPYCGETKEKYFQGNDTDSGLILTGVKVSKGDNSHGSNNKGKNSTHTVVRYNGMLFNISDANNTHIKIISVRGVRVPDHWTCGVLCIILLIGGTFVLIGILGLIAFCTVKRYRQEENSYRIHSQDKCVGPDECGAMSDSALLPTMGLKAKQHHYHGRYRHHGVRDTSFTQVHFPNGSSRLLQEILPVEEMENTQL
ncbi:uncharacterized protein [Haliotis asinina]|uniref:uncharacterized protein n=1 Tax=Haliotis asinina TaxID=109174 RepID=UPI0035325B93